MHTYRDDNTTIHFNSDLSGFVTITLTGGNTVQEFNVPGHSLLQFLKEVARRRTVSAMEDAKEFHDRIDEIATAPLDHLVLRAEMHPDHAKSRDARWQKLALDARKIDAIKAYREVYRTDLRTSKEAVEEFIWNRGKTKTVR